MSEEEILRKTVNKVIENINKKINHKNKTIENLWNENVDKEIVKNTRVSLIKDEILYINASNTTWIYEIKKIKKKAIDIINKKAKEELVKDIKVKLGDI